MSFKSAYDDENELYRINIREVDNGATTYCDRVENVLMIVIRGAIKEDVTRVAISALRAFTQAEVAYYEDGEMEACATYRSTYRSPMLNATNNTAPFVQQLLFKASER